MTAKLLPRFKAAIKRYTLVPSRGGCFELTVGGQRVYSKLETGRFPSEDEMVRAVGELLGA